MNAKQIRLLNLKLLIHQWESAAALAGQVGVDPSQISQIVSPKAVRGLGDKQAQKYERALGKPAGWMDAPHPEEWSRAGLIDSKDSGDRERPATFNNELTRLQHRLALAAEQGRLTPPLQTAIEAVLQLAAAPARPLPAKKVYDIHEETKHDLVTYSDYEPLVEDLVAKVHGDGDAPREDIEALAKVVDLVKRRAMSGR